MNFATRSLGGIAQSRAVVMRSHAAQRRWNSTGPSGAQKEVSPHIGFYKTFTRPVAKVLLMATFTYQLVYWAWVKLETDEIKAGKREVKVLEEQLEQLTKKPITKP